MFPERHTTPLPIVDGQQLGTEYREVLQPGETVTTAGGQKVELPRYFYRLDSEEIANDVRLTPRFFVREFLMTDFREADLMQTYPRYLPVAVSHTAAALELVRTAVGTTVHIACNGGYRSPRHATNSGLSVHCWGTAANIFKIGNTLLDNADSIGKYSAIIADVIPGAWIRPFGMIEGACFDQLHLDLGFTAVTPHHGTLN